MRLSGPVAAELSGMRERNRQRWASELAQTQFEETYPPHHNVLDWFFIAGIIGFLSVIATAHESNRTGRLGV
jgi:hypothetical protein